VVDLIGHPPWNHGNPSHECLKIWCAKLQTPGIFVAKKAHRFRCHQQQPSVIFESSAKSYDLQSSNQWSLYRKDYFDSLIEPFWYMTYKIIQYNTTLYNIIQYNII
jgi:hypothetical protein